MDIKSFYYPYDYWDQLDERENFLKEFCNAGFEVISIEQEPETDYGGSIPAWFTVMTEVGEFVVGWNHHGIGLDWTNSLSAKEKSKEIKDKLREENRQTDDNAISAQSYIKLREYLLIIRGLITN